MHVIVPVLLLEQVILLNPLNPWPTYAISPTIPDQIMMNCPPLNIQSVEVGVITDHFLTVKKYPTHHDLSKRPDQAQLYFWATYVLSDKGPLIADSSIFPEQETAGLIGSLM